MSITELYQDGYTIIPSLISEATCDKLKGYLDTKFTEDLDYNYLRGHYQIHLPNTLQHFPEEIVFNKEIHTLLNGVFSNNYYLYSYTCNANLAETSQPYHMDCSHFHPINTIKQFGSPGPPVQIIVNTYLQDTDNTNGSFDIVPGSHLFTDFNLEDDGSIQDKYINKSVRCNLPKGSVIIRDKRTWHRGTNNSTNRVRYMTGTSYSLNWYKMGNLNFNPDCEELFYEAPFSTWNIKYTC